MSKTIATPKFADGVLVRKRNPRHPDVRNPYLKTQDKFGTKNELDLGRIGTVIKTESRDQKRKDRTEPHKVFYCEVLWRGREKTEWVLQHRLERVEGI